MATTFPSERYQAGWATVRLFALASFVFAAIVQMQGTVLGQGESDETEEVEREAGAPRTFSGITSGFGNKVRGMFGSKESGSSTTPKSSKPLFDKRVSGILKPGSFRNGLAKQIRATTDPNPDVGSESDDLAPSMSENPKSESKTPSRVAQTPRREPFSTPRSENVAPSLDPPSLVGTGVKPNREQNGTASTKVNSPINRFKPSPDRLAELPKPITQSSDANQGLAPRPLPEVITPSQKLELAGADQKNVVTTEKVIVERRAEATANDFSGDPLNVRLNASGTTTRKAANSVEDDPREVSIDRKNPTVMADTIETNSGENRDGSLGISTAYSNVSSDRDSRVKSEQGLNPVTRKPVPASNRKTPSAIAGNATQSKSQPQPQPQANVGYDTAGSGYPLTTKQTATPESASRTGSTIATRANSPQSLNGNATAVQPGMVAGTTYSGNTTPLPQSSSTPRIDMAIPKVRLYVSGPSALQVAKSVPYEVVLKNEGTEELSGVIVSMSVPVGVAASSFVSTAGEFESEKDEDGTETILWHVTGLGPSQSRIFRLNLEASKPEHFAMDVEWTVLPQSSQIQIAVEQPQLTLALEGPSEVLWGKPELYRLKVRNPGNAVVRNVQVKLVAETFGSNESSIGDIQPGGERVVEVELTFQQMGKIAIVGQAASKLQSLEAKSNIDVSVNQIQLESEWNAPTQQYIGSVEDYEVKLHNRSSLDGSNVTCVSIIPDGLSVVESPEGATVVGKEVRWKLAAIGAMESKSFILTLQATESTEAKLRFDAKCTGNGTTNSEAIASIDPIVDLKLTVVDPIAPAPVGQDVQYDLVILNRGTRIARGVKVIAQFSSGIEPIRAEGGIAKLVPGQVLFDAIDSIGPGQQITLRVVAHASEAGVHRFRAELECEDGETQLIEEESTRYLATSRSDTTKPTVRR